MKLLLSLILRPNKPKYSPPSSTLIKISGAFRELYFVDIVEAALIYNHKSHVTKELIKLMQNEVDKIGGIPVERVN